MQESIEYKLFPIQETDGTEYPDPYQQRRYEPKPKITGGLLFAGWRVTFCATMFITYIFIT